MVDRPGAQRPSAGGVEPSAFRAFRTGVGAVRGSWLRFVAIVVALVSFTGLAVVVGLALVSGIASAQRHLIASDGVITTRGVVILIFEMAIPAVVLLALATTATLAALVTLADDVLAGHRARSSTALLRGIRRAPAVLGALAVAGAGIGALLLATPLLVVIGVMGLVLTPVARTVGRRRAGSRWPSIRTLVVLAVPLAPAAVVTVRWGLVVPTAALERVGPIQALSRSRDLATGRIRGLAMVLLAAFASYWPLQVLLGVVHESVGENGLLSVVRVATQVALMGVPLAVVTVAYRDVAGPTAEDRTVPVPVLRRPPQITATAVLLVISTIIGVTTFSGFRTAPATAQENPTEQFEAADDDDGSVTQDDTLDVGIDGDVTPGDGDPSDDGDPSSDDEPTGGDGSGGGGPGGDEPAGDVVAAGVDGPASYTVTDLGDAPDHDLDDGACATEAGTCTLRAALDQANTETSRVGRINFAVSGSITVGSPLEIRGQVVLDGTGSRVTLTGAGPVLLAEAAADYSITNLTFSGATTSGSGAALRSAGYGQLRDVTFTGNVASGPGGAVAVTDGWMSIMNGTFVDNSAPQGSDVATESNGGADINQSTFLGGSSSALHNGGSQLSVYTSIVGSQSIPACTGSVFSGRNVSNDPDCGAVGDLTGIGSLGDHGGWVPTVNLTPASAAVDGGTAEGCNGPDARGVSRPQGRYCDLGAYEFDGTSPVKPMTLDVTSAPSPSAWSAPVTFTAEVRPSDGSAAGAVPDNITFRTTEGVLGVAPLLTTATGRAATLTIDDLEIGDHRIEAVFEGDATFGAAEGHVDHVVHAPATEVEVRTSPSTTPFGQAADVRVTVGAAGATRHATGSVVVSVDGVQRARLPLTDGSASTSLSGMGAGEVVIAAVYEGDDRYPAGSDTTNHLVVATAATVTLTAAPGTTVFGQAVTMTATVAGLGTAFVPTGSVTFLDGSTTLGSAPLVGGVATFASATLDPGVHGLRAEYGGSPEVAAGHGVVDHRVDAASTTVAVFASPSPAPLGATVSVTAYVSAVAPGAGTPEGTVAFYTGGILIGRSSLDPSGAASGSFAASAIGTRNVGAVYEGSPAHGSSEHTIAHTVEEGLPTIEVDGSASSALGEEATFAVRVIGPVGSDLLPSGAVGLWRGAQFLDVATLDARGGATLTTDRLPIGDHDLTVVYSGDPSHHSTSAARSHTVDPAPSQVAISASTARIVAGLFTTYTASIIGPSRAGTATGEVTFTGLPGVADQTVTLGPDGTAEIRVATTASGAQPHVLHAAYSGDEEHQPGTGHLEVAVDHADMVLRLDAPTTTVEVGSALVVDIEVDGPVLADGIDASATVVVLVDGAPVHALTFDGPGTFQVSLGTPHPVPFGASTVTAQLVGSANYAADPSAGLDVDVVAARPAVTLSLSPSPSMPGAPVTASVRVAGPAAVEPSGTVEIVDHNGVIATGPVAGSAGPGIGLATVTIDSLARGTHALTARYLPGTPHLLTAVSPIVEHRVVGTATELHAVDDRPSVVGDPITWTFRVVSASRANPSPTGSVITSIGGREVGRATVVAGPLPGWATAHVSVGALAVGSHRVTATFIPDDRHEPSTASFDHVVTAAEARVVVTVPTAAVTWGEDLSIWARVEAASAASGHHPTGTITLDDGAGQTCTITTNGRCLLRWDTPGRFTVTVTYAGDHRFGPATAAPISVEVTRRTPTLTASISSTRPESGQPVTLEWTLDGPTSGRVQASVVAGRPCTATALRDSCTDTFDRSLSGRQLPAGVSYAGDRFWQPASWSTQVTSIGCFPLTLVAEPSEGGRLTASPGPNCGPADARGYLAGSAVWVTAEPTNGGPTGSWRLVELSPVSPDGDPTTTRIRIGADAGSHTIVRARFEAEMACATVVLRTEHAGLAQDTGGSLWPVDAPNCPVDAAGERITPRWTTSGGVVTGRVRLGTEVRTGITTTTGETELYGYRWGGPMMPLTDRSAASFVVERDVDVTAVFGPRCYGVTATAEGSGQVTIDTRVNCVSPSVSGWTRNTRVALTAQPDGVGYLDRWDGGIDAEPVERTCPGCGPDGADTLRYRATLEVGARDTERVVARFGTCHRLDVEPRFHMGGTGTVEPDRPNCDSEPEGNWYREGSEVAVLAHFSPPSRFGKWNEGGPGDAMSSIGLTMDRDRILRPSFVGLGGCRRVSVRAEDPAWTQVSVDLDDLARDQVCHADRLDDGPSGGLGGQFVGGPLGVRAEATQGAPLVGWQVGSDAGWGESFEYWVGDDVTFTAVACVRIDVVVNIVGDDGEVVSGSPVSGGLVGVHPAPDCPYQSNAWRVGTTVSIGAVGEPMGYTFTGWGGEASGTDPDIEITLDGSVPTRSLELDYTQICHTLTLTHDAADVTVYPVPNCLGADPALRRYVGGTLVLLKGRVPGGKVWQGWVGDVVDKGKVNPAMVVMDDDRSAGHRWRSKDWDEELVAGLEWFGDQSAILAKKAAGVLSLVVAEALTGLPPGCVIFLLGAVGSALELLLDAVGVDADITQYFNYLQETLDFALAGLSCVGAWGLGGSPGSKEGEHLADGIEAGLDAQYGSDLQRALTSLEEAEAARTWTQTMDPQYRGFPKNVVVEESTGIVTRAKLRYAEYKVAKANYAAVVDAPALIGAGLAIFSISQGSGIGWDPSAGDAWGDADAYHACTRSMVPSYLEHTLDNEDRGY